MSKSNNPYISKSITALCLKDFIASKVVWTGRILYGFMGITAAIIYYRQSTKLFLPWYVNNYFNDLLCIPLVLGLLCSMIRYMKNNSSFEFSKPFIFCLALYYSVYFEYYLPQVNLRYTGDPIDVVLYFFGGFLFYAYRTPFR